MSRKIVLLILLLNVFMMGLAVFARGEDEPHWGYEPENGPDHWGELNPDYVLCSAGLEQSPIDLDTSAVLPSDLPNLALDYAAVPLELIHNGHTIQIIYPAGSRLTLGEDVYTLLQFHFHRGSEHTLDGEQYPMELHLVHMDEAGQLAVLGVLLEEGEAENAAYAALWAHLPTEASDRPLKVEGVEIDARALLPDNLSDYLTYPGSLTTPPCTEGVRWLVLPEVVRLSAEQIAAFDAIFENNYRPVQDLYERQVTGDSSD